MSSHTLKTPILLALALVACLALSAAAQQPSAGQAEPLDPAAPAAPDAAAIETTPAEAGVEFAGEQAPEGELVGAGEQAAAEHAVEGEHNAEHGGEHAAGYLTKKDYINFSTAVLSMAIFVWIIIHFAKKPLSQYLIDRSEAVSLAIDKAQKAHAEALALQSQWQKRLDNLKAETEQLMAAARKRAEDERQRIVSEAERSAAKIVSDASASISIEADEVAKRLRTELAERALELALEQLKQRSDAAMHERFVAGSIAQIEEKP